MAGNYRGLAPGLPNAPVSPQMLAVTGPLVLRLRNRHTGWVSIDLTRQVGDLPGRRNGDNYVWDARRVLRRLYSLWAVDAGTYNTYSSSWAGLDPASRVPDQDVPALKEGIRRALEPHLANGVARSFFGIHDTILPDGGSVGLGCSNDPKQVAAIQSALNALGLLDAAAMASETPPKADVDMPATLDAIARFKRAVAEAKLGWAPIRADEDRDGGDKFGGRTYGPFPGAGGEPKFSVFIPEKAPQGNNFVHVFCSPTPVWGDAGLNSMLLQGVRAAFDQTKWIVVGVTGVPEGKITVSTAEISQLLSKLNRPSTIDGLRFSAHSRGHITLTRSLTEKDGSGVRLVDPSLVDLITVFDAGHANVGDGLRQAGVDSKAKLYDATVTNISGIKGTKLPFWDGIRAIAYVRFMQDWMMMGALTPPNDKLRLANSLLTGAKPLPARGGFTAQGVAGKQDFNEFCLAHTQTKDIAPIIDQLGPYVFGSNLPQFFGDAVGRSIDAEAHHYFVAELIHEAVGS